MRKVWSDKERAEAKKICFKCNKEKSLLEYYRHSQMKDCHLNKCKDCSKEDTATYRNNNIEKVRESDRQRDKLPYRVKLRIKNVEKFRKKFPLSYKAHYDLSNAVRDGRVIKPKECSSCNKIKLLHGHHEDYSKPFDVIWLCVPCHRQLHRDFSL